MAISTLCRNGTCPRCDAPECEHHCHGAGDNQTSLFDDLPARPYIQEGQPSAGWSGTDTSKRGEPARGRRQIALLGHVRLKGSKGATAREVEDALGLDHGKVSGPLSVLHRQRGLLILLRESRNGFRVYCAPEYAGGRDYE